MLTQRTLRACQGNNIFSGNKFQFVAVNECLQQIKMLISLNTCAPIYESNFNLSIMNGIIDFLISMLFNRHTLLVLHFLTIFI